MALSRIASALATTEAFLERGVPTEREPRDSKDSEPTSSSASVTLAELIWRSREAIATAAGLAMDQVKVTLEYGVKSSQ
jgi:hypothetical protein